MGGRRPFMPVSRIAASAPYIVPIAYRRVPLREAY